MNAPITFLAAGLILTSAFLSSSEVALFSLSRMQLRLLRDRLQSDYRKIKKLLSDPGGLLITILVINEVVNVSISALLAGQLSRHPDFMSDWMGALPGWAKDSILSALITTPLILIFSEVTPKVVGARANELIATLTARPLALVYEVFAPIRFLIRTFLKKTPGIGTFDAALRESEFLTLLEEGRREGAVQASEVELIRNVFDLDDMTVEEILTPFHRIDSIPATMLLKDALTFIRGHAYSRIPVYQGNKRLIIGILYAKDLLEVKLRPELGEKHVTELARRPLIVANTMKTSTLFRKFKQQKNHLALVQNNRKEFIGIVTLNDVIQSLFEELPGTRSP